MYLSERYNTPVLLKSHIINDKRRLKKLSSQKKFERRMNRLINSMNKYGRPPMHSLYKAALIAAACLTIFIASATQIKAIREPGIEFILNFYERFIDIHFAGSGPAFIVQEYQLNYIPEEYVLTDKRSSSKSIYYQYANLSDNTITFIQKALAGKQVSIDNEHGEITNILVGDKEILVYKSNSSIIAFWSQDGYYMELTCIGDFDEANPYQDDRISIGCRYALTATVKTDKGTRNPVPLFLISYLTSTVQPRQSSTLPV